VKDLSDIIEILRVAQNDMKRGAASSQPARMSLHVPQRNQASAMQQEAFVRKPVGVSLPGIISMAFAFGVFLAWVGIIYAQLPATVSLPGLDKLPVIQELPDPFLMNSGKRVSSKKDWSQRRKEIQAMFLDYQYGHLAPAPANLKAKEVSTKKLESGSATEKQLLLTMGPEEKVSLHLILTLPAGKGPFPVIVKGDLCWGRVAPEMIADAVRRGYLVAEFDRTEIAPDNADRTKGIHPLYPQYDWSTLGAWAWGYHRAVDYLAQLKAVDQKHMAITGHSRGGKATLLAGALDERIALVAPNGSGCGGAGCYRVQGDKSEDIAAIINRFAYWFHPRFKDFIGHVNQLPFDQHSLKALVAPRALLSTESLDDLWANPMGTQVSFDAARQVYEYLGAADKIGIHFRKGPHAHNEEDWKALLDFADLQFFGKKVETRFDERPFASAPAAFSWSAPKIR
jgi:hypothetical protein